MSILVYQYVNPSAIAGLQDGSSRDNGYLSFGDIESQNLDLVTLDQVLQVTVTSDGITTLDSMTTSTWSGWITDDTHYIRVVADFGQEVRFDGDLDTTRYYMQFDDAFRGLRLREDIHIQFIGVQMTNLQASPIIDITDATYLPDVKVKNCYLKSIGSTQIESNYGTLDVEGSVLVNGGTGSGIVYQAGSAGGTVANCVFDNGDRAVRDLTSDLVAVKNSVALRMGSLEFDVTNVDSCMTLAGTAGTNPQAPVGADFVNEFVDYPNNNYTPLQTGNLIDNGVGAKSDATIPFIDTNANLRNRNTCNIGAVETPEWVTITGGVNTLTGVAPLGVHFSDDILPDNSVDRVFLDYDYTWNFDDPTSGTWAFSGKSRNIGKGAVASHIFDTPGTYNVTMSKKNTLGVEVDTASYEIIVTDPDTVFSGTNTTVVSTGVDFTGAPTGATKVTTSDLSTIVTYAGAGKRVLFKRGDSWTTNGLSWPDETGECVIGAFGVGTNPDERGIFDNAPEITVTSGEFIDLSVKEGWRIQELSLVDSSRTYDGISATDRYRNNTILRMKVTGFNNPIVLSHWNTSTLIPVEHIFVHDCHVSDGESILVYVGGERCSVQGNYIYDSQSSHVLRSWLAYKSIIANNSLSGANTTIAQGRHALKFHGPGELIVGVQGELAQPINNTLYLGKRTQYAIIMDNILGRSGPWPMAIEPESASYNQLLHDVLIDSNRIIVEYGTASPDSVTYPIHLSGSFMTLRNNVVDLTGSGTYPSGISIEVRGVEDPPKYVQLLNNTIYHNDADSASRVYGIHIGVSTENTTVINNLLVVPDATVTVNIIDDDSTSGITESNNLTEIVQVLIDPANVDPLLRDYHILEGSSPISAGVNTSALFDLYGGARVLGSFDIGATLVSSSVPISVIHIYRRFLGGIS